MAFVLALALLTGLPQARDVGADVYARVADSVLLVIVENERGEVIGRGSAFVISGGRLVTNAHVVREGKVFVKGGAFKIPCAIERTDERTDLAILTPSAALAARPLTLAPTVPLSGSTVFAIGNPQGLERTITQGLLTGPRTIEAVPMLQVSAAISPGSSGGPIVTPSGAVVGVATFFLKDGQNLNFAIPAAAVQALLDRPRTEENSQLPGPTKTTAAVVVALEKSDYRYQKSKESVWWITFEGDNLDPVEVMVRALNEMVLIAATVKKAPELSMDNARALLSASYDANFAKLALGENGDVVALTELFPDFTPSDFKEAIEQVATLADTALPLLTGKASKSAEESFPVTGAGKGATLPILRGLFELSYDPSKWKQTPAEEPGEIQFQHSSGEAFFKVIAERMEIAPEGFRDIVIANAKEVDPNATLVNETARTVNGLNTIVLKYAAASMGIRFVFYNQVYSDKSGAVQVVGFTSGNLFDEYRKDFLEVFAGFRKVR